MQHANDWARIRRFYAAWRDDIFAAGRNEWGGDAYDWDVGGLIRLTPIEAWLWHDIRACDAVLYPQYPVDRFFVDFGNPVARVAVECDGAQWHQDKERDARRDEALRVLGWTVYRIPGWQCRIETEFGEDGAVAVSPGYSLIRRICEEHGISRGSRPRDERQGDGFVDIAEYCAQSIARIQRLREASL